MDNVPQGAPIIPQGTGKTLYGSGSFNADGTPFAGAGKIGQAPSMPTVGKSEGVEAPTVPQEPAGTTPSAWDELAAKKGFQSPDELARAYQELEGRHTQVSQGLSELIKARMEGEAPAQAVTPQVLQSHEDPTTTEEALKVVENLISKKVRPLQDRVELQDLFLARPDARDYAGEMAKIVKEHPGTPWELAYKAAKSDAVEAKARQAGRQEAQVVAQQKVAAQVGGTGSTTNAQQPSLNDIINDRSIPFLEVQRIVKERLSQ